MDSIFDALWIKTSEDYGDVCPVFEKKFTIKNKIKNAYIYITSLGTYKAFLNGKTIGDFIMAPGFTSYKKRLQYQKYDISDMIFVGENTIEVSVGKGWCVGRLTWDNKTCLFSDNIQMIASVEIQYDNGDKETIPTDSSWNSYKGKVRFSEIYDGEIFDSTITAKDYVGVECCTTEKRMLIPQEGEIVREIEIINPIKLIKTPKNEIVIDFGQNLTGYLEFKIKGKKGHICRVSHAEVLDKEGNFYTENLRSAKQVIEYVCNGNRQVYKPMHTFQGFRYVRLENWSEEIKLENFKAVVVCSDMKRTGYIETSNDKLNKLFSNIIWGQKGNFLDIPTDCPQRDERLGWTGDAQVFIKTASYNYDVMKFFTKWLRDLRADQYDDGGVPAVIPDVLDKDCSSSSAWGDAVVICPWQLYLTYSQKSILEENYDAMKKWIEYIRTQGDNEFLWNSGFHYSDWLNLDPNYSQIDVNIIATAFYSYCAAIVAKVSKILGYDSKYYTLLHSNIVSEFKKTYIIDGKLVSKTQTAHVLTLKFQLCDNPKEIAQSLALLVKQNGNRLTTGFVGTPYLLHVLTENGYNDIAYSVLLQENFPSWLFSVNHGATTIWEHWDSIKEDGSFWSTEMNSFNHYAYGAVADFMYEKMAGINIDENEPGFKHILFKPYPNNKLQYMKASILTKNGTVVSEWRYNGEKIEYSFTVPENCTALIEINNNCYEVNSGKFTYEDECLNVGL